MFLIVFQKPCKFNLCEVQTPNQGGVGTGNSDITYIFYFHLAREPPPLVPTIKGYFCHGAAEQVPSIYTNIRKITTPLLFPVRRPRVPHHMTRQGGARCYKMVGGSGRNQGVDSEKRRRYVLFLVSSSSRLILSASHTPTALYIDVVPNKNVQEPYTC
jgi:hypothetical protein